MLLALDAGNTRVKAALFDGAKIIHRAAVQTQSVQLDRELATAFANAPRPDGCLIASVVPAATTRLLTAVRDVWQVEAVVVTARMNLGIAVGVPRPEGVGIDRLLEAAEAFRIVGGAVVVAALGSAVTVDLVSGAGVFRGGTILPGMGMGLRALHAHTGLLPDVVLKVPDSALGADTEGCMRAGVVYGAVGAVERIYEALSRLSSARPALVLTGGDAELASRFLQMPFRMEPDLVLRGLASLYGREGKR